MGKLALIVIALCCNVLHLSNAGSPLNLEFFQSLSGDDKAYEVITAARIKEARKLIKRKVNSLDVCFLVDITGSMTPHIQAVRDSIRDTVNGLKATAVKTVRMSFVGYRDFRDKTKIQIIPFTTNVGNFLRKVGAVPATGGGDFHEDVYTGLLKATKRRWRSHKRVILHMADAPCHGPGCRDNSRDDTKDPLNRDIEDIFTKVRVKKLFYTFGRITPHTNAMLTTFAEAYGKTIPVFDVASGGSGSRRGFGSRRGYRRGRGRGTDRGRGRGTGRGRGRGTDGESSGRLGRIKVAANRRKELKRKVGEATFGAAILAITD